MTKRKKKARKHVLIAMPTRTGMVWVATMKSLMQALSESLQTNVDVSFTDLTGNPVIGMARSLMLAEFLKNNMATHLLFVDDDVAWPLGSVSRIVNHNVDLVGGVYPRRFDPPGYVVRPLDTIEIQQNGLAEVEGLAGGFMCISKNCAQRMTEAYPESYFEADTDQSVRGYELFRNGREGSRFWGEDYEFCRLWRAIGGKVYADCLIPFIHAGFKEYHGVGPWIAWLKGEHDVTRKVEANGDGSRDLHGGP